MTSCKICQEKDARIKDLEKRIDDILEGYKGDKKVFQLEEKWYKIALGIMMILETLTLAFGADGVKMVFDLFKGRVGG